MENSHNELAQVVMTDAIKIIADRKAEIRSYSINDYSSFTSESVELKLPNGDTLSINRHKMKTSS